MRQAPLQPALLLLTTSLLAVTPPAAAAEEPGVLVDRIVATVSQRPISASEVAMESAIRTRIQGLKAKQAFGRLLTEPGEPLEAVIFKIILLQQPSTAEVQLDDMTMAEQRLDRFEQSFDNPLLFAAFLKRWAITQQDLLEFFHLYARLDTVIEVSVDPQVKEEEERAYYERNRDQVFGGREFTEVADLVSRQVYLLKFEVEYNAWRSRLRARASKRYIGRGSNNKGIVLDK